LQKRNTSFVHFHDPHTIAIAVEAIHR
jgi:hypothetical protein